MTLELDGRQRAMLEEMGVRLFRPVAPVPEAKAAAAPAPRERVSAGPMRSGLRQEPAPEPVATIIAAELSMPAGTTLPPSIAPFTGTPVSAGSVAPAAIDTMSWQQLQEAVAARAGSTLFGAGDRQAQCVLVADAPGEDEERQGEPFVGAAGVLLDHMLAAMALSRSRGAWLTHLVKWRGSPDAEQLAWCEAVLRRQLQLVQPKVVLAMGRLAVQTLLRSSEPPGQLRGRVHAYGGLPLVVSYPVAALLRKPEDKAKAWSDLCLALQVLRG